MNEYIGKTLPYRTAVEDLIRLVEASARGRSLDQIQALFPSGTYQGTLLAAEDLGFLDQETKAITELGSSFLLRESDRSDLLFTALMNYEPYQLLFEAIFSRSNVNETPVSWVANWWGTNNFGNSQNNREDGAISLAKYIEFSKLGKFVIGRRGRPTRIEWNGTAMARVKEALNQAIGEYSKDGREPKEAEVINQSASKNIPEKSSEYNSFSLNLGEGKNIELRLPPKLTSSEKNRLIKLIELMIDVENDENKSQENDSEE